MTRPRIVQRNLVPTVTLRKALSDPSLLGNVLRGKSWNVWCALLIASMGEQLTDAERVLFKQVTQRDDEPLRRVEEFVGVIGRRGGKSRAISAAATYLSGLCSHPTLAAGERGVLLVIAADQKQADIVLDYVTANFEGSRILSQLIESRTQRTLRLRNHIDVEVRASDFRTLRGPTYIAVIADEVAFWHSGDASANPDDEILNAVRPGLATTGGPMFLISSPYARRGELWRTYHRHYGSQGDPLVLVAQGSSRTFNKTLSQSVVDRAIERDPASAAAEYGAQFRTDIESFVSIEAVRACVSIGIHERPPQHGLAYSAFCDPSGGSVDSMTLAIAHRDWVNRAVTVDALREIKPPFSPESAVTEFTSLLKTYNVGSVEGDPYAGEWPVEAFAKLGIRYDASAKPKSDLYRDLLPLINSRRVHLLDHGKLINQLTSLERRTARGGKDSIDHPPGAHDDIANAVAGVGQLMHKASYDTTYAGFQPEPDESQLSDADRNYLVYVASGGAMRLW